MSAAATAVPANHGYHLFSFFAPDSPTAFVLALQALHLHLHIRIEVKVSKQEVIRFVL